MTPTEGQQALHLLGQLIGAGTLVWAVSWIIRKVRKVNWHLSYLLSIVFLMVLAILVGAVATTPEKSARYAAMYLVTGFIIWVVAAAGDLTAIGSWLIFSLTWRNSKRRTWISWLLP